MEPIIYYGSDESQSILAKDYASIRKKYSFARIIDLKTSFPFCTAQNTIVRLASSTCVYVGITLLVNVVLRENE